MFAGRGRLDTHVLRSQTQVPWMLFVGFDTLETHNKQLEIMQAKTEDIAPNSVCLSMANRQFYSESKHNLISSVVFGLVQLARSQMSRTRSTRIHLTTMGMVNGFVLPLLLKVPSRISRVRC